MQKAPNIPVIFHQFEPYSRCMWDLLRQKKEITVRNLEFLHVEFDHQFLRSECRWKKDEKSSFSRSLECRDLKYLCSKQTQFQTPTDWSVKNIIFQLFFFSDLFFFFPLSIFLIYTSRGRSAVRWSGEAWLASSRRVTHVLGLFALQRFLPSGNAGRRVFLSFQMTFKPPVGFLYLPRPYVSN